MYTFIPFNFPSLLLGFSLGALSTYFFCPRKNNLVISTPYLLVPVCENLGRYERNESNENERNENNENSESNKGSENKCNNCPCDEKNM